MSEFVFTVPIGAASLNQTGASSSAPTPKVRTRPYRKACVHCHGRKVKCDKQSPCSNCQKLLLECSFPSPFRTSSRQAKEKAAEKGKEPDAALLDRIKQLEVAVQDLGALKKEVMRSRKRRKGQSSEDSDDDADGRSDDEEGRDHSSEAGPADDTGREIGKLIVEEGKSRYISGGFWGSLEDEDDKDLQVILDDQILDRAENNDRPSKSGSEHHGFPFSPANLDLHSLHPPTKQIRLLWETFTRRVDPLAKVLHKPTIQRVVTRITENPEALERLDKPTKALIFAIYFSAVTTMTDEELEKSLGGNKRAMAIKYRKAAENALMNADFLSTQEFVTLQAFIIYLACVRWSEDTRMVWTLTGLALRIAQSLGLHRDGKHFPDLAPFDREIRRRVWWHLRYLDCCSSQDHGSDPTSTDLNSDTRLPLNINDSDIDQTATEISLNDHEGVTDMTFCLIRYDMTRTSRLMKIRRSVTEKEILLKACYQRLESKYLSYCQYGGTLYWLAENIARMAIAREWLLLYHDQSRLDRSHTLSRKMKDRLFLTNLQIIERSIQLESDSRADEWRWLIPRSHQWLPMVAVLAELCVRSKCDVVDRAWRAVEASYNQRSESEKWKSGGDAMLRRLMEKARAKRDKDLSIERWDSLTNASVTATPTVLATSRPTHQDAAVHYGFGMQVPEVMSPTSPHYGPIPSQYSLDAHADQPSTLAPWNLNNSASVNDMGVIDDSIYWNNWDLLVMDFEGGVDGQGQYTWEGAPEERDRERF